MTLKHCFGITSQVGVFIHREENIIDVTGGWMTLTFDILDLPEKHAKVARIYKVAVSTELLFKVILYYLPWDNGNGVTLTYYKDHVFEVR